MTLLYFTGRYEREPLEDALSRTLGSGYRLERELFGGGMSRVFVAFEIALNRYVAIKVLAPDLAASLSVERFRREILVGASLQHPHIVGVLSAGEIESLPYFVMPFIDGPSLRAMLAAGRLSVRETVRIARDVARALEFAHARGVVHRDIKPDNILLADGVAMVTDFGVAKAVSDSRPKSAGGHGTITSIGTSLGTPTYMSPEQLAADPQADHRADIYSFGATVYEMLAGTPPFHGKSPQQLLTAHLTERPRSLAEIRGDVPEPIDRLVLRCLAKDPSERPQRASEIVALLEDPATQSGDFAGVTVAVTPRTPARRLMGVTIAVLVVTGALLVTQRQRTAEALPNSIAVLPVVDLTQDDTSGATAAALNAELRAALGQVSGLAIAPATSADAALDVRQVGSRLHVRSVLQLAAERDGRRIRVAAQLVSAKTGLSEWSDVFEGEAARLFDARRQISDALVRSLRTHVDRAGAGQ